MDTDRQLARPIINMVTVSPNTILSSSRLNSSDCTISNNSNIGYENPGSTALSNCGFTQIQPATTLPPSVMSGSVVIAEPIPVATITAVTRLNNEMITTTALNIHPIQQQHHQATQPLHTLEPQQHQQYYQWMQHYQHQHQHQSEQHQLQQQQQQQHQQSPSKPPYYNLHEYQATTTTNPLQDYSTQSANYGNSLFQNEPYKIPTHINIPEHSSIIKPAPIGYQEQLQSQQPQQPQQQQRELQQAQHQQQLHSHPLPLHLHFTSGSHKQPLESFSHQDAVKQHQVNLHTPSTINRDNKQALNLNSRNPSLVDNGINVVTKPYATATPFYSHPYAEQRDIANPYYDNFKMKVPTDFQESYTNNHNSLVNQSHKFYTAAKSQLQEHSFAAMGSMAPITVKPFPNTIHYNNTANNFYPYVNGSSCEKYMYPSVANSSSSTFSPTASHRLPVNDTASELTYRKNSALNNIPSSWPWTSEHLAYNNRNRVAATTSANRIPTATVAPTHTNYLNQNSTNMQKNTYHTIQDLSPTVQALSYQKSYPLPQNTNTNYNTWYNSSQTHSIPANKDRIPYQLAATNAVSPTPYLPINVDPSNQHEASFYPNTRQQCCSQLQNYYYHTPPLPEVRPANLSEFTNHTSAHIPYESTNRMPHINQSCRYQSQTVNDMSEMKKIKNPLDVYPTPPFEAFDTILPGTQTPVNNANYQTGAIVLNNSQSMLNHGQVVAHSKPVNNFPNDLNQVANQVVNTFITPPPLSHIKSTIVPQSIPQAVKQTFEPTPIKCALKDYRKPNITMELCQTAQNPYQNISAENYSQNIALNYSQPTSNFTSSQPNNITHKNDAVELSSEKVNDSGIKNLSLRDFIANWNDDEDDGPITEQVSFLQAGDNIVTDTIHTNAYSCSKSREVGETAADHNLDALKEFASNAGPCMNLPDILIDIEKSNSLNAAQLSLDNFDFEKELDELQINKSLKNEEPTDNNKLTDTLNTDANTSKEVLEKTVPLLNTEGNNESGDNNIYVALKEPTTNFVMELEPPPPYLPTPIDLQTKVEKVMQVKEEHLEHLENPSNTNHNANSFEKEYHIFINKITNQNTTTANITKEQPNKNEELGETPKMIIRKRKRKHKALNAKKFIEEESIQNLPSPAKGNLIEKPQRYNRLTRKPYRIQPLYYQLINRIRRQCNKRLLHIKNIRNFKMSITKKKKFIRNPLKKFYSPQNLRHLCILLLNTNEFRHVFLQHYRIDCLQDDGNSTMSSKSKKTNLSDNTSVGKQEEEEHICKDPYCDTCDVIKTLMQSQTYQIITESDTKLNSPYEVSHETQANNKEINEESYTQENYLNHDADDHAEENITLVDSIDEKTNEMNSSPSHDEDSLQTENNKTNLNTGNTMSLTKDEPPNIIQNCLKINKAGTTVNTRNINTVEEEKVINPDIGETFHPHNIEENTLFNMANNDLQQSPTPSIPQQSKASIRNSLQSLSSPITTDFSEHESKKEVCHQYQSNEEFDMKNLPNIDNAEALPIKEIDSRWMQTPSHSPLNISNSVADNSNASFTEDFIGFQQFPTQQQNGNQHTDFRSFGKIHAENQYEKEETLPKKRRLSKQNVSINDCNRIKEIDINDGTEESNSNSSSASSATSKSSNSSTSNSSSSRGRNSNSKTTSNTDSSDRQTLLPSLTPTKELQPEAISPKSPTEGKETEVKENEILENNTNYPKIPPVIETNESILCKELKDSEQILDNGQRNDKEQSKNLQKNLLMEIPKLSDLCQTALSSLPSQQLAIVKENPDNDNKSVEEALEEMYRQAGITIDEPIALDNINSKDTDTNTSNNHDEMILVNLHEILSSDESEVYVLQCDVNENILDIIDSLPSHPNDNHDKANVCSDNLNHSNDNSIISENYSIKEATSTDSRALHLHLTNTDFIELESYNSINSCSDHPSFVTIRNAVDAANDNHYHDGDNNDLSLIHHEEIVPDNYIKFLREEFFKYLHEKYIQRHSTKFHHANRILRKYRKLVNNNKSR